MYKEKGHFARTALAAKARSICNAIYGIVNKIQQALKMRRMPVGDHRAIIKAAMDGAVSGWRARSAGEVPSLSP